MKFFMATTLDQRRGPFPLIWGLALALSVLAHVGLFRMNPQLWLGAGVRVPLPERVRPDVVVRPVEPERMRRELPRLLDQVGNQEPLPEASGPERPAIEDVVQGLSDPTLPDVEVELPMSGVPEREPEPEPPSTWTARQEVLAVTDIRVEETLEVLPREFRNPENQVAAAPDITLPAEQPSLPDTTGALEAGAVLPTLSSGLRPLVPQGIERGFPGPAGSGAGLPGPLPLEFPASLPAVNLPENSLVATEDLLQLSVRVYDPPGEPAWRYFKLQLMRNGIESLPRLPRDVVYLIDCSASMTEAKLQLALEGVRDSLVFLEETDRVQVIAFRDGVETFPGSPMASTVFGKAQVRSFLSGLHARGQTDVFASLRALNELGVDADRPKVALFITDGVATQGVQEPGTILEAFTRENQGRISVFGLGGGDRVNRVLLDFLGFRNRGTSLVSPSAEGLRTVIPRMMQEIRRPVLVDLEVDFTGAVSPEVYPNSLSHLYVDRPWILIGRTRRNVPRLAFQVVGESVDTTHDILFSVDLDTAPAGTAQLRREWAWQAGLEKLSRAITSGDPEAFSEAEAFLRKFEIELPSAYRN